MATRPMDVDDLYRLILVGDAQIAPDGSKIAYLTKRLDREKNDYVSAIWLWENGQSRQFTAGEKDSAPRWSPDGSQLAFVAKREEKQQIYVMPTDGGEARRLTDAKLGAGTPVWSPDGKRIAYCGPVSTIEELETDEEKDEPARTRVIERAVFKFDGQGLIEDRRTHVFVVDLASGETKQVTEGDFNDSEPAWSPDGEQLAFAADRDEAWDLRAQSDIWIVPRAGGHPRRVTDGQGNWTTPTFSPDGSEIAFVGYAVPKTGEATRYSQLWTISRSGGEATNLLAGTDLAAGHSLLADWSIAGQDGPFWENDGIYLIITERGAANIYRWQDGLDAVTSGRHDVMDFSVSHGHLACTVAELTHPAEVALVRDGKLEPITEHNRQVLREAPPIEPERVTFTGAAGAEIDGWLMRPSDFVKGRTYPLIVYIHGGPTTAYGESFFHEFQVLAGKGFGVFYCNPHGSTGSGQSFQSSIRGDWGNLDYQDVMAGVERAVREPWVDPNRLGVAGGSYGGFMTNWIIGHTDRFAAACTQRSICNMVSQGGISDWAATRGEALGATPEGNPGHLWEMSPLKYASQVKTPTLILHSERDDRCPIAQGEEWYMALRRQCVPVRFVRFPEESHNLSRAGKPSRRAERMGHILDWFATYL
ncbi:MAG: S9 family peptidase [Chloroflexota bacterium]|nr:S9 family peptidase [Chloroflexota bacterium]